MAPGRDALPRMKVRLTNPDFSSRHWQPVATRAVVARVVEPHASCVVGGSLRRREQWVIASKHHRRRGRGHLRGRYRCVPHPERVRIDARHDVGSVKTPPGTEAHERTPDFTPQEIVQSVRLPTDRIGAASARFCTVDLYKVVRAGARMHVAAEASSWVRSAVTSCRSASFSCLNSRTSRTASRSYICPHSNARNTASIPPTGQRTSRRTE